MAPSGKGSTMSDETDLTKLATQVARDAVEGMCDG